MQVYDKRESRLLCGTKFLRVLIFAIFAVFFAIRKNKFQQHKITVLLSVPFERDFQFVF